MGVWIAGKGRSLLRYNWKTAGPWRIGVNHSVNMVPNCHWACGIDKAPLLLFNSLLHITDVITSTRCTFVFRSDITVHGWSKIYQSSGPAAVDMAIKLGATKIHLVGFDSLKGDNVSYDGTKEYELAEHIVEHTVSMLDKLIHDNKHLEWYID